MVKDVEVTRDDLVLQHTARGNVDVGSSIGDNDHRALQHNIGSKRYITCHRQVVQLEDMRWVLESCQKVVDLLEVVAELHKGNSVEHAFGVDREFAMVQ